LVGLLRSIQKIEFQQIVSDILPPWTNRLKWDKHFLAQAELCSQLSKDPSTKVGAVIVNNLRQIVGSGYNGFPRGVQDLEDRYNDRETKLSFVVHAEVNACLLAGDRARGGTIYITPTLGYPPSCNDCSKVIIQVGISRVVGWHTNNPRSGWQRKADISEIMLREAGIQVDYIDQL
jgi:dCMP deaminase